MGSLTGIAPSEELHATRFEGDRAYVVTYEPVIRQTDPLWVVSLTEPQAPKAAAPRKFVEGPSFQSQAPRIAAKLTRRSRTR